MKRSDDRRRRLTFAVAGATCLVALAACTGAGEADPSSADSTSKGSSASYDEKIHAMLPTSIIDKGEIVDGVAPATPPKGYLDADGKYIGYEPEIAAELSKIIGIDITVPAFVTFDAIIPGIDAGRYDTSGFNDTLEREKTLDFVDLLYAGSGLVVPDGNPKKVSAESLCGLRVGIQKGSTQIDTTIPELSEKCTSAGKPKINLAVYPDNNSAVLALRSDRADAVMADTQVAAWLGKETPGVEFVATSIVNGLWGYGFTKGSELVPVFEAALTKMHEDGTLDSILEKYDIQSLALEKITVNGAGTIEK